MIRDNIKRDAEEIISILERNDEITRGIAKALQQQVDDLQAQLDDLSNARLPWED